MLEPKAWFAATMLAAALIIAAAVAYSLRWGLAADAFPIYAAIFLGPIFVAIGFFLGWRTAFAFLVAPLWAPATTPYIVSPSGTYDINLNLLYAAILAYGEVLTLGMPAFLILRARNRTAFWIAPVVGFGAGVLTDAIVFILLGISLGNSLTLTRTSWSWPFFPTGGLGAVVGATLWLIARPDRERAA